MSTTKVEINKPRIGPLKGLINKLYLKQDLPRKIYKIQNKKGK